MIRLTLLGGIDLVGPDSTAIPQVLQQPKRIAVLAYLALAGPGAFRSRDTTLALFWPDSTSDKARQSLSQAAHFLRRSLGNEVIVNRGPGELGVCPDALWCDAAGFDQALKRGDQAEATRLYSGDLLPGFFIDAAPEFDQWLAGERNRLRRRASAAAWKLAQAAEKDTDFGAAAVWADRAMELSSNDEGLLQNLLRMLERMGNQAGALKAYESFARRLAVECRIKPSVETMQIVTRLRSQPELQRISGAVMSKQSGVVDQSLQKSIPPARSDHPSCEEQSGAAVALPPEVQPPLSRVRAASRPRWWQAAGLLTVAAVLCGLVGIWGFGGQAYAFHPDAVHRSEGRTRIVIDTLADLGRLHGSASIGRALTAEIIDRMARVQSFDVTSVRAVSPTGVATSSLTNDQRSAPQLLITGSVLESEGRVHVNIQIADAVSGRTIRTEAFDHPTESVLPLVDTLALQISSLVRTAAGHEVRLRAWSGGAMNRGVYELMQRADEDANRASQLEDSGDLRASVRALENADAILRNAGRIAPDWGEPMLARANVARRLAVSYLVPPLRDPARARVFLERGILEADSAVSINRNDAWALESLGSSLYWYWLVVPLPTDSAQRVLARAELNLRGAASAAPGHASALSLLSASLYAHADYNGSYATASQAYQEDAYLANTQEILNGLFITAYEIGDDSASAHWCDETNRRFERSRVSAYCRLSLMERDTTRDRRVIRRAWKVAAGVGQPPTAHTHMVEPDLQMLVAAVLARQGLRDSAEAVIQRARKEGAGDPEMLPYEAEALILLKRPDAAASLLTQYFNASPSHNAGVVRSRRFVTLEAVPRNLVSLGTAPGRRR